MQFKQFGNVKIDVKKQKIDIETIRETTGLTAGEIEEL